MSCCGSQRESMRSQAPASGAAPNAFVPQARDFEYTGQGELQVAGPLTGTLYVFRGRGARVRIHNADVASLISVPSLHLVA